VNARRAGAVRRDLRAEISQVIGSLTAAQKTALVKIAKAYDWKTTYGHEDLIPEALMRALEGKSAQLRGLPGGVSAWSDAKNSIRLGVNLSWRRRSQALAHDGGLRFADRPYLEYAEE
jgi:hypothetical protein